MDKKNDTKPKSQKKTNNWDKISNTNEIIANK